MIFNTYVVLNEIFLISNIANVISIYSFDNDRRGEKLQNNFHTTPSISSAELHAAKLQIVLRQNMQNNSMVTTYIPYCVV